MQEKEAVIKRAEYFLNEGLKVKSTVRHHEYGGSVDRALFTPWQVGVQSFLNNVFGSDHVYSKQFSEDCERSDWPDFEMGYGILQAATNEIKEGFLGSIKQLVSAELFDDFLSMSEHYLEQGHKDSAAMLGGAVLEDSLKRYARSKDIKVLASHDLSAVNQLIAGKNLYSRMVQQQVQSLNTLRNHADHGEFDQYNFEDVKKYLGDIRSILVRLS